MDWNRESSVLWRKWPDAEQVCREWGRFKMLWETATDGEREELKQALVVRVEMNKKEGTCKMALLPQVPSFWFGLTPKMGAAGEVIAMNPSLLTTHTFPPVELDHDILRPKWVMRRAGVSLH